METYTTLILGKHATERAKVTSAYFLSAHMNTKDKIAVCLTMFCCIPKVASGRRRKEEERTSTMQAIGNMKTTQ